MNDGRGHDAAREIARGLCQVITQALAEGAQVRTFEAAQDLAQLLSLRGLDRLLGGLARHAGTPWPLPMRAVVHRLESLAAECARDESLEAFRRSDAELGTLARALELLPAPGSPAIPADATPPPETGPGRPVSLATVLADLPLHRPDADLLGRGRLAPAVAGALRAALDWLLGDATPRRPLTLTSDGSALEILCEGIAFPGVHPASEVLGSVGAHLGPSPVRPGAWTVRVPWLAERDTFLMIEQGDLALAVPWHSVARVRLVPAATIEAMAQRQGLPVLPRLASAARPASEQPVIVVGLGLKRACLVADRLVWRMAASPDAGGAPPAAGLTRAVRADDDTIYWVLDPAWLLRDVVAPAIGEPTRKATPVEARRPAEPPPPIPFPIAAMRELRTEDVEPLHHAEPAAPRAAEPGGVRPARDVEPLSGTLPPTETVGPPPDALPPFETSAEGLSAAAPVGVPPPVSAGRQVMVVEDSITARIFLVRLLEQQGFVVHPARSAAELRAMLRHGPWSMLFVDVELPDARGVELLLELAPATGAKRFPIVALVRDAADEAVARAAGVTATLRKPYEREVLEALLARLLPAGAETRPAGEGADDDDSPGGGGEADPAGQAR